MEICKVENVTFTYPEQTDPVLESINISVQAGEFIVIFGESGSGKTTLLKMLKRELTPHGKQSGDVFFKGKKLSELDDRMAASEIGYVMQNPETQIVTDKVWHELAFGLENIGTPNEVIRARVGETANFFGIHTWFRDETTNLSGGQKQLLNLASIMVMEPDLLLLDEPTSQLDPIAATNFMQTLEKINRDLGMTIILIEHRLEEVLQIADKVVLLEKGKIVCMDQPRHIGSRLKKLSPHHPMLYALPTPMRVFDAFQGNGESPLTVREGRTFLQTIQHEIVPPVPEQMKVIVNKPVLELKNVWFRYTRESQDILEGVNLSIGQGEMVSILGGNGSGKTTLLQVLSGIHRPYRGKVLLHGEKIQKYKGKLLYKKQLAMLPQDPQTVFLKATVHDDYMEIKKVLGCTEKEMEPAILKIANLLAITHLLQKHPYDLSGGEQQKAALGKVLLLQPKILLLDEPTKGMDAFAKQSLGGVLQSLQRTGITIILVTHDIEFAATVSHRVGLFFDRQLLSMDTPKHFFSQNNYYTTVASRMSRGILEKTVTTEDIVQSFEESGETKDEKSMV